MKVVSIIAVLLLAAANALALAAVPAAQPFKQYLPEASLVLGLIALAAILAGRAPPAASGHAAAQAARPTPTPVDANRADAEVVSFLATLQDKGRLVDFLMDDINAYDDAQVGAAARVVHAGCKASLQEHFQIRSVREETEGSTVQVPAGYAADEYRLIGNIRGQAPFSGVLVHCGWKTDSVTLPRLVRSAQDGLPTIAPAEVELK